MPKKFKELTNNSSQSAINEAILALTPLMSKRLARLLDSKAKKRIERNQKLSVFSKNDKETFVISYNLVVEMREQRVEKLGKTFRLLLLWAKKFKGVTSFEDAIEVVENAVKK